MFEDALKFDMRLEHEILTSLDRIKSGKDELIREKKRFAKGMQKLFISVVQRGLESSPYIEDDTEKYVNDQINEILHSEKNENSQNENKWSFR